MAQPPTLWKRPMAALALALMTAAGALLPSQPAAAQFSDSYNFLKAVRDKDVLKARELITKPGSTIINARDRTTGESALHIAARRDDPPWIGFLLNAGADPNIRDGEGNTPLMIAAKGGMTEAMRVLLLRAQPDAPNGRGETPLIMAVQLRNLPATRMLLDAGADPDRTDNVAGMSARDYATQDRRGGPLAKLLADAPRRNKPAAVGPRL